MTSRLELLLARYRDAWVHYVNVKKIGGWVRLQAWRRYIAARRELYAEMEQEKQL